MAWISSGERRRYWQTLPLSALAWMALTSCLTFASVGLATNLVDGLQWPFWWVLARAAFFGAITALSLATILRNPKTRFSDPHSSFGSPWSFCQRSSRASQPQGVDGARVRVCPVAVWRRKECYPVRQRQQAMPYS